MFYRKSDKANFQGAGSPILFDRDARPGGPSPRTLLIFVPASRYDFNISGIYPLPPLGIACLAAHLRQQGYFGTAALDMPAFKLDAEKARGLLARNPFDAYGLSSTMLGLPQIALLSRIIKTEINPRALVILGGAATRFEPEDIFGRIPHIDVIVRGEGEAPLEGIINRLKIGGGLDGIPGTALRNGGGAVVTPPAPRRETYDARFARDLLPMSRYRFHPPFGLFPPATTVETQRGCDYGCAFCSLPRAVSARPVGEVIEELKQLKREGYREIYFIDPTFPINRGRAVELCEAMISEGLGLKWVCKSRVDTVDPELLALMAAAGCYMISYGVESGSEKILGIINKQVSVETVRKTLASSLAAGIRPLCYILIGVPGETEETVRETVGLLIERKVSFTLFGELVPDPGAPIFYRDESERAAIDEAIKKYYFDGDSSVLYSLNVAGAPRREVRRWLTWANRAFYLRPVYIAQRLRDLKNFTELLGLVNGFYQLAKEAWRVKRQGEGCGCRGKTEKNSR